MTGTQLRDLFLSPDFKQGLTEMSSYLASIMQERPIVYLLAKCLWQRKYKFELEDKRHDLSLRAYPKTPAARRVIQAQAKWRNPT